MNLSLSVVVWQEYFGKGKGSVHEEKIGLCIYLVLRIYIKDSLV